MEGGVGWVASIGEETVEEVASWGVTDGEEGRESTKSWSLLSGICMGGRVGIAGKE